MVPSVFFISSLLSTTESLHGSSFTDKSSDFVPKVQYDWILISVHPIYCLKVHLPAWSFPASLLLPLLPQIHILLTLQAHPKHPPGLS